MHPSCCNPFTAAGAQLPGSRAANVALICGLSRPTGRRVRVAPLGAGRSRTRFGPTQDSRQNGSLARGVWHSLLPLSVPPRHRRRRRCSSFVRVWPFPLCAGERKRSQTLNFTGGNTLWLTRKPVAEVRIGRVKATIWLNGTEEQPRHNVTFSRLYKDDAGEWKSTQSFGRNDLLVLAKVADQAHTRLFELPREEEQQAES